MGKTREMKVFLTENYFNFAGVTHVGREHAAKHGALLCIILILSFSSCLLSCENCHQPWIFKIPLKPVCGVEDKTLSSWNPNVSLV